MKNSLNPISDRLSSVFFHYAIPTILGLLSMASATIVDGIFVGNYVGADALAAVNLCMPFVVFIYGGAVMMAAGGSVICGKYLGEGRKKDAAQTFSKITLSILIIAGLITFFSAWQNKELALLLGAQEPITGMVEEYLWYIVFFVPSILLGFGFVYFVRVNHQPKLASVALISGAILNFFLDWLLVVYLGLGVKGAALATGIAQSSILFVMLSSFIRKTSPLRFVWPQGHWKDVFKAAYNGFSELLNEASTGFVVLVFNIVIIRNTGVSGVAAFTVINYLLYMGSMVAYGVGESLHAPVSINYGAKLVSRISGLLKHALAFNFSLGIFFIMMLILFPQTIIQLFLKEADTNAAALAAHYIHYIWPTFLFNGIAIALSGYYTAMHRPNQSAIVALLRSLMLPIGFIFLLEYLYGGEAIFWAIPLAEGISLLVSMGMFYYNSPERLCNKTNKLKALLAMFSSRALT